MSLTADYLSYPERRHGMDHNLYPWSDVFERPPIAWPGGAHVALWVTPILQWFPLNASAKPFRAPGGLTMPYPDFRHYSSRDYGNRVGIFRILDVLKELGIPASVALNAAVAQRYPALVAQLLAHDVEFIAHGQDMGQLHYGGMPVEEEQQIIAQALQTLRQACGKPVRGWLSPARSQSFNTAALLVANGIEYGCDWANDDLPYAMRTASGELHSMPMALETDDRMVSLDFHQNDAEWMEQVCDRFDVLYREAKASGGRVISVPLHAWIAGVPYRIGRVREVLSYILGHEGVWAANGAQILDAFKQSQAR